MRNVRISFTKLGRAKYISHLDINRCMSRAVRRAGIPLWYTEGFHPHPYMTFSLPLSLGVESLCETMDIRVEGELSHEEIMNRMNRIMPEGLRITAVSEPKYAPKEIAFARYEMEVETLPAGTDALACVHAVLDSGVLTAMKKGKAGRRRVEKEVNLCEYIQSWEGAPTAKGLRFHFVLAAGSSKNLNPLLLLDTLMAKAGLRVEAKQVVRTALLTEDLENFQ